MIPKNLGTAKNDTPKSGSNPQKSTQNNGTFPYHDIMQVTPLAKYAQYFTGLLFISKFDERNVISHLHMVTGQK